MKTGSLSGSVTGCVSAGFVNLEKSMVSYSSGVSSSRGMTKTASRDQTKSRVRAAMKVTAYA